MVDKTNLSDQEVKSPQVTTDNADLETANVAELLGVVSSAVNKLDGAGLEIVDGEVRVNSDVFDGNIEGLSNPMTADLDASGFNISNAGTIEGQALEAERADIGDDITIDDFYRVLANSGGSTRVLSALTSETSNASVSFNAQYTESVGDTATSILENDAKDLIEAAGIFVVVFGRDINDSNEFVDYITQFPGSSTDLDIWQSNNRSNPAERSYTGGGGADGSLQLAMAGGEEFNITTFGLSVGAEQ